MEYLRDSLFERLLCKRLLHEGCLSCCSFLEELGGRQDLGTRVDSSYWYQLFVSIQSCSDSDTYPYFIVSCPEFRFSKIEGPPSANFALQPTNSLEKPNHHLTDL